MSRSCYHGIVGFPLINLVPKLQHPGGDVSGDPGPSILRCFPKWLPFSVHFPEPRSHPVPRSSNHRFPHHFKQ